MSTVAVTNHQTKVIDVYIAEHPDDILKSLSYYSKKISHLRHSMNNVGVLGDADAIFIELDGVERLYFHFFNQYRMAKGFRPLQGEKFSTPLSSQHNLDPVTKYVDEEIRYQSLLFQ